jgi:SAM-dependent methyltransferase
LTSAICERAFPASVLGCDPAETFIDYARGVLQDDHASFVVAGTGGLPARAGGYGSVTSLLALNFFPDPQAAVSEMRSLTARRGRVSACVWDYAGRMEMLRFFWDTATALDPSAREQDEGKRFPLCHPDPLRDVFGAAGLSDVRCDPIEIPMAFPGFDDYWRPLLGGTGPAPSYVASLSPDRRTALARRLERTLPHGPDGAIALTARAFAVCGIAP